MTNHKSSFYEFWKYYGLTGSFLIGIILFVWGILRYGQSYGAIFISYVPMATGLALASLSFAEFLRIIRKD